MRKSFGKILVYVVFLSLVVLLSEFLYTLTNKNAIAGFYYYQRARASIQQGNPQGAVDLLVKWAESDMYKKRSPSLMKNENYEPVIGRYPNVVILEDNEELNKDIKSYLSSIDFIKMYFSNYYSLSRIFYDLALLSFQNHSEYLFPRFLQTAINLNPQDSYLYIELANFYYNYGQIEEAEDVLDKCQRSHTSTDWCSNYSDNRINVGLWPHKPGFLLEESGKFYDYPSLLSTSSSL